MSRIGKQPITIPSNVSVAIAENMISLQSSGDTLSYALPRGLRAEMQEDKLVILVQGEAGRKTAALWGLSRARVANMVEGLTKGFIKKLEFEGIGYRASMEGDGLLMQLGFTHPVRVKARPGIAFRIERNIITVSGIDKAEVGQIAADIRALKPPEPYKGKGIRYQGEIIRRKAGKKAVAGSA